MDVSCRLFVIYHIVLLCFIHVDYLIAKIKHQHQLFVTICYHRSIIKYFIYLVELLLDEDAECIEALSALESRVGEYTAIGLFLAPGIFQLLPEFL